MRSSAQSDEQRLKAGVILCSIGVRYKSYCSNTARTFIIDPHKTQQDNFSYLIKLQTHVLDELKDGVVVKDLYAEVLNKIEAERPDLKDHFLKNIGFLASSLNCRRNCNLLSLCRWASSSEKPATRLVPNARRH